MNKKIICIILSQLTVSSCAATDFEKKSVYSEIKTDGSIEDIGISFELNAFDKICNEMLPDNPLESGGLIFQDKTVVDENSATPFKPKSSLSIVFRNCFDLGNDRPCGFTINSTSGIKYISSTKDLKNMYFIHDGNIFVHVKINNKGTPISFSTRKWGYDLADTIAKNGTAMHSDIDLEYNRILKKFNDNNKYKNFKIFAFNFSVDGDRYFYSSDYDQRIWLKYGDKLKKTDMFATDLYNPLINSNGKLISHGFSYDLNAKIDVVSRPFTMASGQMENFLEKEFNFKSDELGFLRRLTYSGVENIWKINGKSFRFQCPRDEKKHLRISQTGGTHFKYIDNGTGVVKNSVFYFFGGPSGQFFNDHYSDVVSNVVKNGLEIVVPYYGGSMGAGLQTSRRFYKDWLSSVEFDAKNINNSIKNGKKIDVIAYSFGAIPAVNFASRYPDKVKNLILVAPYIKFRDPTDYRKTKKSVLYQKSLENSWYGSENDSKRPNLNKFLYNSYEKLEKSGVKIHFIFGSIDRISNIDDMPSSLKIIADSITIIEADHQLVTAHPSTNRKIYEILGLRKL